MMYEPAYTLLAMKNAREEDLDAIRESYENFKMAVQNGEQTVDDDLNFHLSILNATHNPFVIRIGETVYHLFKAAMEISLQNNPTTAFRDHERIFEAFCEKDVDKMQNAILQSFENWKTGL
jgi:GntR family transcriptional repressor for pyruvate dehydrogenase complex